MKTTYMMVKVVHEEEFDVAQVVKDEVGVLSAVESVEMVPAIYMVAAYSDGGTPGIVSKAYVHETDAQKALKEYAEEWAEEGGEPVGTFTDDGLDWEFPGTAKASVVCIRFRRSMMDHFEPTPRYPGDPQDVLCEMPEAPEPVQEDEALTALRSLQSWATDLCFPEGGGFKIPDNHPIMKARKAIENKMKEAGK